MTTMITLNNDANPPPLRRKPRGRWRAAKRRDGGGAAEGQAFSDATE